MYSFVVHPGRINNKLFGSGRHKGYVSYFEVVNKLLIVPGTYLFRVMKLAETHTYPTRDHFPSTYSTGVPYANVSGKRICSPCPLAAETCCGTPSTSPLAPWRPARRSGREEKKSQVRF